MMKKLVYISILSLLLLSSCRSKRMITVSLPQPVMQADSTQLGDTIGLPARLSPMFTFDQSDLRNVRRQPAKGEQPYGEFLAPEGVFASGAPLRTEKQQFVDGQTALFQNVHKFLANGSAGPDNG